MRHLDLFSGIGGFAYAADQVFGGVEHIFCDNDEFCRQVLNKHWPEAKIYDDVTNITDTECKGLERGVGSREHDGHQQGIDLLTGGFPCQSFSQAGLRRGTSDERFLWPEMHRVIRLTKPTWVIAENVNGLLTIDDGLVFEQVCLDLEACGYEVQPFVIPAVAVNAPHRRDRVWFVATDTEAAGRRGLRLERQPIEEDTESGGSDWQRAWMEVAAEFCSVDDGLPVSLDGFKLTKSKHRENQIKAYGNSIVPQIAMKLMEGMLV